MREFRRLLLLLGFPLFIFCGCPSRQGVVAMPVITPAADVDSCAAMCAHIGPKGLNCPEGQDVYDSDKAGPPGTPNESCEDFCKQEEGNGVYVNPKCVSQAPTCADIEIWRLHTCQ